MRIFILSIMFFAVSCTNSNTAKETTSGSSAVHSDNEWPKMYIELGLPQYNAGKIVSSEKKHGDMRNEEIIILDTNEKPPQIREFYETEMAKLGWTKTPAAGGFSGLSENDYYAAMFIKGKNKLYINAKQTPSVTSRINISLSEYYNNH